MTYINKDLELLDIRDFTHRYNISRSTLYKLIGGRSLAAVKVGRRTFIRADEAERWAASLQQLKPGADGNDGEK